MVSSLNTSEDHVPSRPVSKLPNYAQATARNTAASKLETVFGLPTAAAKVIADTVVDPAELRRSIEAPVRLAVPGGYILAVRAAVWAPRVMPDPRNPRIGPSRRHPFAVAPGTDEESRFRPVPDPTSPPGKPWLEVEIESREQLTWALDQAKRHIFDTNDWRYSIRNQGVLTEVWLTATRYVHKDGCPDMWVVSTSEGSSRITADHDIMGLRSVDCAYDVSDRQMRVMVDKLNDDLDLRPTNSVMESLRCASVPSLILVGFEALAGGFDDSFSSAVRSLVALRHVDAPKEWGEGPEMESLADAALQEMERKGLLTTAKRAWMAGSITREEATSAHLSADAAVRAAAIVEAFTSNDPRYRAAIRDAVTAQSTRKKLSPLLRIRLAAALVVRGVGGVANAERIRRYLQLGFGEAVRDGNWSATFRSADELLKAAITEYENDPDELGPERLELAARGAYPLIAGLQLHADRGTANNEQPDRRTPGLVIDAMLREPAGLRQLHRGLVDMSAGRAVRIVDETGSVIRTEDDAQDRLVTDTYLRSAFPPAGTIKAPRAGQTGNERLQVALAVLSRAIVEIDRARKEVEQVTGTDGTPIVDVGGVAKTHCDAWQATLAEASDAIVVWRATWQRRQRASSSVKADTDQQEEAPEDDEGLAAWDDDTENEVSDAVAN